MLAVALLACSLAALAEPAATNVTAFLPNRSFGLGEQQVYVIERNQTIVVRYHNADGDIVRKTLKRSESHSVAMTVVGYAVTGAAMLGVAVESASSNAPVTNAQASPLVGADGMIAARGPLGQLAAVGIILGNLPNTPIVDGAKWNGSGVLRLPLGSVNVRVANTAAAFNGDPATLQVTSAGTLDTSGSVVIAGAGKAALRGGGTCNGSSFVDMADALVSGSVFNVASRGNLTFASGDVGEYTMTAAYTVKLARYVPGRSPAPTGMLPSNAPGLVSGAQADSDMIRPGGENPVANPAPTDNLFSGASPFATSTPAPDQSLAPVPVPVSSNAPIASPPAPPPTPFPTSSPH